MFFPYLRKTSRTSLKRRIHWEEDKANLEAFDRPENFAGVPHDGSVDASRAKGKAKKNQSESSEGLGFKASPFLTRIY